MADLVAYCSISNSESEVAQSCPTLCDPVDCSLPGSSVHGILQARVLEWVTISFSRGSSQPRDRTQVSGIPGRHFNLWATFEWLLISWISKMFYHQIVSKTIYKLIKTLLTPTLSYCSMQSIWKVKALGSTENVGEYVLDAGKD